MLPLLSSPLAYFLLPPCHFFRRCVTRPRALWRLPVVLGPRVSNDLRPKKPASAVVPTLGATSCKGSVGQPSLTPSPCPLPLSARGSIVVPAQGAKAASSARALGGRLPSHARRTRTSIAASLQTPGSRAPSRPHGVAAHARPSSPVLIYTQSSLLLHGSLAFSRHTCSYWCMPTRRGSRDG